MRPGEVASDQQAFQQILGRLEGEIGTLIGLVIASKEHGCFSNTAPFWSLARMMFPIAESVGDLIYREDERPARNLICVLENEFQEVRAGYLGKAETLALLYRHSLIHQDELRTLETGCKKCGWVVSFGQRAQHLKVTQSPPLVSIQFDTTAFYDDLVAVCRTAFAKNWDGKVKDRYNDWLTYDLDVKKRKSVISEISKL